MKIPLNIAILFWLVILTNSKTNSQNIVPIIDTTIYYDVDQYPILITEQREYELKDLKEFIKLNIKYPDNGMDCQGKVYISCVVEKDGHISSKKYIRKLCKGFDENALSVVDLMKKWKPGYKNNKPVRTWIVIPIGFTIY
jgi:hypothetical protein